MITELLPLNINSILRNVMASKTKGRRARKIMLILIRDNFRCVYCNRSHNLTIAHNIPIRRRHRITSSYKQHTCKTVCVECHLMIDRETFKIEKYFNHNFTGC